MCASQYLLAHTGRVDLAQSISAKYYHKAGVDIYGCLRASMISRILVGKNLSIAISTAADQLSSQTTNISFNDCNFGCYYESTPDHSFTDVPTAEEHFIVMYVSATT